MQPGGLAGIHERGAEAVESDDLLESTLDGLG
jgi:hypothetical protein